MKEFVDYMGVCVDTEDMPKHLAQTLNSHICFKGGGGGGTTTTKTELDPEIRKRVTPALDRATQQYEAELAGEGQRRYEAGLGQLQSDLSAQRGVIEEGLGGLGEDVINDQLKAVQGQGLAGGNLGSARADRARQGALADRALQLNEQDFARKTQAAEGLSQVSQAQRQLAQEEFDVPHQALGRFFGYLGSAPQSSSSTSNSGGGGGK